MALIGAVIVGLLALLACRLVSKGCAVLFPLGKDAGRTNVSHCVPAEPHEAWDGLDEYLAAQCPDSYLVDLKAGIDRALAGTRGRFSVFFDDFESVAWVGVNENERYQPWSLIKLCIVAALLKKVEQHGLSLNQAVALTPGEVQAEMALRPDACIGTNGMPLRELVNRIVELSDNTAGMLLARFLTVTEVNECLQAMGLPVPLPGEPQNIPPRVSPRQYASLLKALYYSSYLQPPFSELVVSLMADTAYDAVWIKAGLPPGVKVAHKVGFNADCGDFHDCAIVYLPGGAYALCVMSTGSTREEADRVISNISRQVYAFIQRQGRGAGP
jgi:beta-lactamase class A